VLQSQKFVFCIIFGNTVYIKKVLKLDHFDKVLVHFLKFDKIMFNRFKCVYFD